MFVSIRRGENIYTYLGIPFIPPVYQYEILFVIGFYVVVRRPLSMSLDQQLPSINLCNKDGSLCSV